MFFGVLSPKAVTGQKRYGNKIVLEFNLLQESFTKYTLFHWEIHWELDTLEKVNGREYASWFIPQPTEFHLVIPNTLESTGGDTCLQGQPICWYYRVQDPELRVYQLLVSTARNSVRWDCANFPGKAGELSNWLSPREYVSVLPTLVYIRY